MKTWISEIGAIAEKMTGNAPGTAGCIVQAGLGIIALILVFRWVSRAMDFPLTGTWRAVCVSVLSLLAAGLAVAAINIHVLPSVKVPALQVALPIAAAIIGVMGSAVPVCMLLHKSGCFQSFLVIVISMAAAAAVMLMAGAGFRAFSHGGKAMGKIRSRAVQADRMLRE